MSFWETICLGGALLAAMGISVSAQTVTLLHRFQKTDSINYPYGPPVQGRRGELVGETFFSGWGSVFNASANGEVSQLYVFSKTDGGGGSPESPVLLAGDGNWYGTTTAGPFFDYGALYRITPKGVFSQLYNFSGTPNGLPSGSLIEVNGKLYGMTVGWDAPASIYTYDMSGAVTVIYQFTSSQFAYPVGTLVQGADGNLYGGGTGSDGCGAVFKLTPAGILLNIYNFDCSLSVGPVTSTLVEGSDGAFYGTASGYSGIGAIFKISPNGVVSLVHRFNSSPTDGLYGVGLAIGTDANLYGTTPAGGNSNGGTIYQVSAGGTYRQLDSFRHSDGYAASGLVQHTDGKFYGFLEFTGRADGEFYSLDMGLGPFVTVSAPQGSKPGHTAQILGQGLTGTSSVTFNGVAATKFSVVSDTYMTAVVPAGATTGAVVVTTPAGDLSSNVSFRVTR